MNTLADQPRFCFYTYSQRRYKRIVAAIVLIGLTLVSCGPSQAELDAQATVIAASIFATQTAQAPTSTPTFTPTSTSTPTPTKTARPTSTNTPRPTNTPSPTNTPRPTSTFTPEPIPTQALPLDAKVTIINELSVSIIISLSGPYTLYYVLTSGETMIVDVPAGTYTYSANAVGYNPLVGTKNWTAGEWEWRFFDK